MVKIPGIAYFAIGVGVITISSFVGDRYRVFFYVGFVFVFVGLGKILYTWMTKEDQPSTHAHSLHGGHHATQGHQRSHQTHHRQHPVHRQHHTPQYKTCRRCHHHATLRAHYCYNCGARV